MSYRMRIDPRASKAGRFIARVHKEIQKAFGATGMSQQELASKLEINRATVNKRLLGQENLTLRSVADLAWGMDADIKFELVLRTADAGNRYRSVPPETATRSTQAPALPIHSIPVASGASAAQKVVQVGGSV